MVFAPMSLFSSNCIGSLYGWPLYRMIDARSNGQACGGIIIA